MNAIEIRNLSKSFRSMYAVDHLCMTVPQGAIRLFGGTLFATGLGACSCVILRRSALV